MGSAQASEDFTVVRNRAELEEALDLPAGSLLDAHTLLEAPAQPKAAPRHGARLLVEWPHLRIEVSGTREAVLRVLHAINLSDLAQ